MLTMVTRVTHIHLNKLRMHIHKWDKPLYKTLKWLLIPLPLTLLNIQQVVPSFQKKQGMCLKCNRDTMVPKVKLLVHQQYNPVLQVRCKNYIEDAVVYHCVDEQIICMLTFFMNFKFPQVEILFQFFIARITSMLHNCLHLFHAMLFCIWVWCTCTWMTFIPDFT